MTFAVAEWVDIFSLTRKPTAFGGGYVLLALPSHFILASIFALCVGRSEGFVRNAPYGGWLSKSTCFAGGGLIFTLLHGDANFSLESNRKIYQLKLSFLLKGCL